MNRMLSHLLFVWVYLSALSPAILYRHSYIHTYTYTWCTRTGTGTWFSFEQVVYRYTYTYTYCKSIRTKRSKLNCNTYPASITFLLHEPYTFVLPISIYTHPLISIYKSILSYHDHNDYHSQSCHITSYHCLSVNFRDAPFIQYLGRRVYTFFGSLVFKSSSGMVSNSSSGMSFLWGPSGNAWWPGLSCNAMKCSV